MLSPTMQARVAGPTASYKCELQPVRVGAFIYLRN